jgi:hypothetical protein
MRFLNGSKIESLKDIRRNCQEQSGVIVSKLRSGYVAHFLPVPVMIYSCSSVRDSKFGSLLSQPFMSGTFRSVKSLRRDPHSPEPDCWLHGSTFCLSTRPLATSTE